MPRYFKNFPNIYYRFGDRESPVIFNNISTYVDLIDQIQDDVSTYEKYTILSGDRADTVSYKLYGSVDYYWTFYYLNPELRESGWPLTDQEVYSDVTSSYPHLTIITEDPIAETKFKVGANVRGTASTVEGTVVAKRNDLGQIIIDTGGTSTFQVGEQLRTLPAGDINPDYLTVYAQVNQYDSTHHYENTDGEIVDIDPFDQSSTDGLIPVTYTERYINKNNDLKQIKIFRPGVINAVNSEFQKLLRQ